MRLLETGPHAEAGAGPRECIEIRQEALAETHWLIFSTMSVLGESLTGQDKFTEAEPLLLDAYEGMQDHAETPDERKRQALRRIVNLYEAWHAAEPDDDGDHGRDAHATKAAEWRPKRQALRATTQPATSQPAP